jgi:hypothetical protein
VNVHAAKFLERDVGNGAEESVFTSAHMRVARQRKLIRKLVAEGKDAESARRLLATYEELLQILSLNK